MNSWKVILATVVIFGAGVLTGGFLVNQVDRQHGPNGRFLFWKKGVAANMGNRGQHPGEMARPRSPAMWRRDFIARLDKDLKLTPEQHATISKIVAQGQERNREIWTNVFPKLRDEMEQVHQRIRTQLTPDQQKRFDEMVKHFGPHHPHNVSRPRMASPTNNAPPPSEGGPTGP